MQMVTTVGLDVAKSVFQVHAVDAVGQVIILANGGAFVFRHLTLSRPLAVIDLETTSLSVKKARIVEISVCSVKSRSSSAMSSCTRTSSRTASARTTYTPSGE